MQKIELGMTAAHNGKLAAILEELASAYRIIGDTWRSAAFEKAHKVVDSLAVTLTLDNYKDVLGAVPGIGKGVISRIEEFLKTGKLKELEKLKKLPKYKGYKELSGVMGFGKSHISKLFKMGIKNLAELKKAVKNGELSLTKVQKLGLKYYRDLKQKIPRKETEVIGAVVAKIIGETSNTAFIELVGSYRRLLPMNSDVDILVTSKVYDPKFIEKFIERLRKYENFFIDTLSEGDTKVSFLVRSPVPPYKVRQCDVRYVESDSWPTALLYFTGSKDANKAMRRVAKIKGYKLSEYGLFKGAQRIKIGSEADVYKILGLKYLEPYKRI